MNFCPVESDLDRMYRQADMREQKYKRIREWLISSGRVEDAIIETMRTDGDFEQFVAKHIDGYAVIQLGLLAVHPVRDFDSDYLKKDAARVCEEYIEQEFEETLGVLIDNEWLNWEDE